MFIIVDAFIVLINGGGHIMHNVRVNTGLRDFRLFKNYELLINSYELKDIEEIENWWIENHFPEYHELLIMFNRRVFMKPNTIEWEYNKTNEYHYINWCNRIVKFKGSVESIRLLLMSLRFTDITIQTDPKDKFSYTFLISVPEADNFNEVKFRSLFYQCCYKLLWFTDIKIKYKIMNISVNIEQTQYTKVSIGIFNNIELKINDSQHTN